MFDSLPFLASGILFGLVAGLLPGPLLTLVISETLRHNKKEGIMVATAPAVTDVPIIFFSVFILSKLSEFELALGAISLAGALFIAYLAYESITIKGFHLDLQNVKVQSLKKGILTNLLSPHPYLFWMTVGAPTVVKGYSVNLLSVIFFISGFYVFLIGSKILVALIVDRSKSFLKSSAYIYIIRILGFILLIFTLLYIRDALRIFGVI
ncbi:MAG: LysE family translocator [Nitrospira sp.]|nr:LysE family translocator [Nitrospira sp.]